MARPVTPPANAEHYAAYTRAERVACVGSTSVSQVAFDPETGHVFVTWKSGDTYCYEAVGPEGWEQFRTADSKGKFANGLKATHACRGPLL